MSPPITLMVQGTTSDAGKTTLVAGLARVLRRRGIKVAPFKPQNMALNSAVTADGGEIGRAQALQALAAGVAPHTDFNPVLLKPSTDIGAQVVIHGRAVASLSARDYHAYKPTAMAAVMQSWDRLCSAYAAVLVEGAGSPAEINLRDRDIANMGFAEAVDCPVILVADIDRGGVFAHLVGTLELLSPTEHLFPRLRLTEHRRHRPDELPGERLARQLQTHAARGGDPPTVAHESVRDVEHRTRPGCGGDRPGLVGRPRHTVVPPQQRQVSIRDRRRRREGGVGQPRGRRGQAGARPPEGATDRDDVTDPCARAQDRRAPAEVAERRDRHHHHASRRRGQVSAENRAPRVLRRRSDARCKIQHPRHLDLGIDHQGHQEPGGHPTHRSHIGDILGDQLPPDVMPARPVVAPVPAAHHRVSGRNDASRRGGHNGRVVTGRHADPTTTGQTREDREDLPEQRRLVEITQPLAHDRPPP